MESFEERQRIIEAHPGWQAHVRWSDHYRIYSGVYLPNRVHLIGHIKAPNNDDNLSTEMMQNVRPPVIRERYINELLRLLHNYLASEFTLVDHARVLIKNYEGTNFETRYKQKLASVSEAPVHWLLQDMRSQFLHKGILPIRWNVTLRDNANNSFSLTLNVEKLLRLKKLSAKSKEFLKNAGKEVELLGVVEQHGGLIDSFNSWLHQQFTELHSKDIEGVNQLIRSRNKASSVGLELGELDI